MPSGRMLIWTALISAGVYIGLERYKATKGA